MSISQNFPNTRPSLNLNFARSKTLDHRITFSRSSTATYIGSDGLVKTATSDIPRFDHSPTTNESLGLLIEEQSTNLVTDNTTNFNYYINGAPATNDVAPDGTTVACKHSLIGLTQPFLNCRVDTTLTAGSYTMSMWLKSGVTSFSGSFAFVGETTNEIYSNTANVTTSWQRFTLTFTLVNTQTASRLQLFFASEGENKVVSIWGAQLEKKAFATSYILRPVAGQQSTRNADNVSIDGANFTSWFNPSEGTIFWTGRYNVEDINLQCYSIDPSTVGGDANNRIALFGRASLVSGTFVPRIRSSGNNFDPTAINVNFSARTLNKCGLSYKTNSSSFSVNSLPLSTSTPTSLPSLSLIKIGSDYSGTNFLNGTISQLLYYPLFLSNAQLQTLTK